MSPWKAIPTSAWHKCHPVALVVGLVAVALLVGGCRKNVAEEASDSDANGYLCTKCGAKYYTPRSVFLPVNCPKCREEGIVEVVGYYCERDKHLTVVGRHQDRGGAATCEKCQAPLNGMRLPRENDLKAWGAVKVPT